MAGRLSGKRAAISGAGRGLGQAFAVRLAQDGASLVLIDKDDVGETADLVARAGGRSFGVTADLAELEGLPELCERVTRDAGPIDILVNNAAICPFQPSEQITLTDWRLVMAINLDAPFLLAQGFLKGMRARRWGRIVSIAGNTVWRMNPNFCHYTVSKAGIVGLTRALSSEVGNDGVTVNAIAPSLTRTPMTEGSPARDLFDVWRKGQAIDRLQEPQDLLGAMSFFCSDESAFITGQTLIVDGGMVRVG